MAAAAGPWLRWPLHLLFLLLVAFSALAGELAAFLSKLMRSGRLQREWWIVSAVNLGCTAELGIMVVIGILIVRTMAGMNRLGALLAAEIGWVGWLLALLEALLLLFFEMVLARMIISVLSLALIGGVPRFVQTPNDPYDRYPDSIPAVVVLVLLGGFALLVLLAMLLIVEVALLAGQLLGFLF